MTQERWSAVDRYLADLLVPADPALAAALETSAARGLPPHQVSPPQGKLLHLLARACGARTILEIGTLGAYSTIWLARALPPDGRLITIEADPRHAEVARANLVRADLTAAVDLRLGRALDVLPQLAAENRAPFDLTFIDADKANTPDYFTWSVRLSHPGSVIIVDNVVRDGAILDEQSTDPSVQGIRRFHHMVSTAPPITATAIQTVGTKGWDGFTLALVT
jgi:predicted O-methyltransferase YrrM